MRFKKTRIMLNASKNATMTQIDYFSETTP